MHDKKKKQRIFHKNMQMPWNIGENVTYMSNFSRTEVKRYHGKVKHDEFKEVGQNYREHIAKCL